MVKFHIYVGNIWEGITIIKLYSHTKALKVCHYLRQDLFMQLQAEVKLSALSYIQNNISCHAHLCKSDDCRRFMAAKYFFTATINTE